MAKVPQRGSDEWMRWSPYGKQLPLTEVEDGMRAELELGLPGTPSIEIRLKKSAESDQFDQLLLDLDREWRIPGFPMKSRSSDSPAMEICWDR